MTMTKTEAADILALDVVVWARRTGAAIDKDLCEARMSEARHRSGLFPTAAAAAPSWRTVLRLARRYAAHD